MCLQGLRRQVSPFPDKSSPGLLKREQVTRVHTSSLGSCWFDGGPGM